MTAILVLSSAGVGLGVIITWLLHKQSGMPVVEPKSVPMDTQASMLLPMISVIIPARNEERNIRRCIEGLVKQNYPNFELIVVDDRSNDGTAQILAELAEAYPQLRIVPGAELQTGWVGKTHSLVQGARVARGEWLCFMDADTFAQPSLLWSTYEAAVMTRADMFSILTRQELGSFWEKTILPLVFLGLSFGFPAERVNDPGKPDAIANGQFILIRRPVYDQVGGHTAVKERIDEDKAIAVVIKRAGYRLVVADGRKLASTHMYSSLAEMWEGWTKNIYPGMQDRLWLLTFGAFIGLVVSIALPIWLVGSLIWLAGGGGPSAVIIALEALILWGYLVFKRMQVCQEFGIQPGYAFTFPLGAMIFTGMMVVSAFYVISGWGASWKGRKYR